MNKRKKELMLELTLLNYANNYNIDRYIIHNIVKKIIDIEQKEHIQKLNSEIRAEGLKRIGIKEYTEIREKILQDILLIEK